MRSKIIGTGSFLPKKIVTNHDLEKILDTSDEWINKRTGIRQRHIADVHQGESGSDMGYHAAKKAMEMALIDKNDIDYLLVATCTADYRLPTNACLIQDRLGLKNIPALDIAAACAGSIYGLELVDSLIKANRHKTILFVCAETLSRVVNWQDRGTAVLFGDGASACVIQGNKTDDSGFIDINNYADGSQKNTIYVKSGGTKHPTDEQALKENSDKIFMNGRETFRFAVRAMCDSIEEILNKNNVKANDIRFAVPHQANLRIIEAISKRMGISMDRFLINLDKCANTSAASLLLAYDQANRKDLLKKDDLILMLAIGAGFVWGTGLYRV